jgi:hypothetical protein
MEGKSKKIKIDKKTSLNLMQNESGIFIQNIKSQNYELLGNIPEFKYRFILSGKEEFRSLKFTGIDETESGLILHSSLNLYDNEEYAFDLRITSSKHECAGSTFFGVAFRWEPACKVPWAVELTMSLPLNVKSWNIFVQDLYTKNKQAQIDENWTGIDHDNWQAERSPIEFAAKDGMALWGRLDNLDMMFSSKAVYDKNIGPLFSYNFTFESQSKKIGPEYSILLACDKNISCENSRDIWLEIFKAESVRFRKLAGIKEETLMPMANLPIDGGTPGCAPQSKMKIRGSFDEFAEETLALCEDMNYKRVLVGSPWISHRTENIWSKCTRSITYDSRCGIIDFEISEKFGGREAFKRFCRKAHSKGIEVFVWYPGFHLSNYSPYLTKHPEWVIRKPDGSPATFVFYHLSVLSPRLEAQRHFLEQLKGLKKDCEFDGLWLDSYNNFSFMGLDFSIKHGVSTCREGIDIVKHLQKLGFKIINEGYSPFGARGDGEAMFYSGQEHMASETSLFTYWKNTGKITGSDSYFRFLANKAPLTLPIEYIPAKYRKKVAEFNRIFLEVEKYMKKRTLLKDNLGVLWRNGKNTEILFAFKDADFKLPSNAYASDLSSSKSRVMQDIVKLKKQHIYVLKKKA